MELDGNSELVELLILDNNPGFEQCAFYNPSQPLTQ